MKKYSNKQISEIEENYEKMFGCLPHTPIGFGIVHIVDFMEKAIKRGTPLEFKEYEKRFHYKEGVTY